MAKKKKIEKKDNKIFKIIWNTIKGICIALIVLIVAVIVVQRVSNNKFTLGGYSIFTVVTESMLPEYKVGDMLLSHVKNPKDIKIGDDVVYQGKVGTFADKIVTHRVIETEEGEPRKFHTKGINNFIEDPVIDGSQIYGVVITKLSVLSVISGFINNQYGFFFIIFVPIVVLVFEIFIDVVNDNKKKS